jgi:hypothetical protein
MSISNPLHEFRSIFLQLKRDRKHIFFSAYATWLYDAMGRTTGRSITSGNTTTAHDNMGRQTGTIRGSR